MITGIAHVCIGAIDLEASLHFYTEVLGLKKHFSFVRDGRPFGYYLSLADGLFIEIFQDSEAAAGARPLIKHFCLAVDDIDRTVADLRARGAEISDKKLGMDQSWQAWTTDPAGIRIEFHQYTPESSQYTQRDCVAA